MKIDIFTDGACSPNPGVGGYGIILSFKDKNGKVHEREISGGFKDTTNNRMELYSVIVAIESVKTNNCELTIYSDSAYVVNAISKDWVTSWEKKKFQKKKNVDLWKRYLELAKLHTIKTVWVKGHAGHPKNERCDFLATSAIKRKDELFVDVGYEEIVKNNK